MGTYHVEIDRLPARLPEYESIGPQLFAKIGDLCRFAHQKSLMSFSGTDPIMDNSGDKVSNSKSSNKRCSPYLLKTLFESWASCFCFSRRPIPSTSSLTKSIPKEKYYVYPTVGMTSFLHVYYGKVRDCFKEKVLWYISPSHEINLIDRSWNQPLDCPIAPAARCDKDATGTAQPLAFDSARQLLPSVSSRLSPPGGSLFSPPLS